MKAKVEKFEVLESTSSTMTVLLRKDLKLVCQRHSDRRTGSSCWESYFMKYGKWKCKDPFGGFYIEERWGVYRKANAYRGVILAKRSWSRKQDIIDAINSVPEVSQN